MKLPVSEVFTSIQGEGPTMGRLSVFLRLSGCNLMCGGQGTQFDGELHNGAQWRCDTVEVWMKGSMIPFEDILSEQQIDMIKTGAHLIVTGGEPLMHQEALYNFLSWLTDTIDRKFYCEVETNGTVTPYKLGNYVTQYNVSPKLSNSGNSLAARYKADTIKHFSNERKAVWKFVVANELDWEEIETLFMPLLNPEQVWLMPAGESQELLAQTKQWVAELAIKNRLNFSTRMHIEIWNKKTGV